MQLIIKYTFKTSAEYERVNHVTSILLLRSADEHFAIMLQQIRIHKEIA